MDKLSGQAIATGKSSYKWRDSNMHWNYNETDTVLVEVCSNYSTVELLLNGKSLGYRSMSEAPDRLMRWVVPFKAGKLEARAVMGKEEITSTLTTASKPIKIELTADKIVLKADAYDVSHLVVQLLDKDGIPVQTENTNVEFVIEGDAKLLGVDCGNFHKHQDFQSNKIEPTKVVALLLFNRLKMPGK